MRRGNGLLSRSALLLFVVVLLAAGDAWAKPAPTGPEVQGAVRPDSQLRPASLSRSTPTIPWARLLYGTVAVIALICGGVYVLKKLNGGGHLGKRRYLEVLEARPVGRNVQLILVKVAGRIVLLAFGGDGVTPVAEFSEEEVPQFDAPRTGMEGFRALFKKLTGVTR